MKSFAIVLGLVASTVLGAAVPAPATPQPHNLTLVLDTDDAGEAIWRLLDENIPAHVKRDGAHARAVSPAEPQGLGKRGAECYSSHRAYSDDCRILDQSIQFSTSPVPNSPRNIVYATCYISWSKVFTGEQSRFWAGAYDTIADCTGGSAGDTHNMVSGIVRGYLPNGAAQCLSNRATGCS
jgi:hypothetical protein